jgi:hypothetical protein
VKRDNGGGWLYTNFTTDSKQWALDWKDDGGDCAMSCEDTFDAFKDNNQCKYLKASFGACSIAD